MAENKAYRVKFNENEEYVDIDLNLNQDIDVFEMLTLKVGMENFYHLQTSNYGVVAGRVLANNAIGVPNVKISIFISADEETDADSILSYLYPYKNTFDKNEDEIRYNLLPEEKISECHQAVGTFPSKRLVLDDNNVFEIFDKYYKFTTTTNYAGDYMIFGVPKGSQNLHMDVDLSDIGDLLSQTPRDFIYKGYDVNQFENPVKFKKSTNLNTLPQILSQDESVYVHPFWGDPSEMGEDESTGVRISRKDINLNYEFEPTCIFMGSLVSDEKSNGFSEKCVPTERMGKMDRLTTGEGTIEMIRKTPNGTVESFNVNGSHVIDGDGTWCYQIPMNLDYVRTDEYGNIVPTDNPNKGLPTRTRVRFRVSLGDYASDYENNHLCKMLVPNNPSSSGEMKDTYIFGTNTPENEFRDLLWNKVYTVKSYIPRLQKGNANREKRFSGVKAVNVNGSNNPIPYNNMRIDITFMFTLQCAIMNTLIWFTGVYNKFISTVMSLQSSTADFRREFNKNGSCLTVGDGACPDLEGWYFAPNCHKGNLNSDPSVNPFNRTIESLTKKINGSDGTSDSYSVDAENKEPMESVCLTNKIDYFKQCMELALAQEYEVIQFDFYNDWLNGVLYLPRWFANIRKKRNFLFGLITTPAKVYGCMESSDNYTRRFVQQFSLKYKFTDPLTNQQLLTIATPFDCESTSSKCHGGAGRAAIKTLRKSRVKPGGGVVHREETTKKEDVYYFRPCDFSGNTRLNYFLTDIVLLGSVNENDIDDIPQLFKELSSSTYKMPTNIAATNMDTVGRMYGNTDGFQCGTYDTSGLYYGEATFLQIFGGSETAMCPCVKNNKNVKIIDGYYKNQAAFNEVANKIYSGANNQAYASHPACAYTTATTDCVEWAKSVAKSGEYKGDATGQDVNVQEQTYSAYENWASKTDYKNDLYNDSNEYPVTEAAGIDWQYTGPEQEKFGATEQFKPGGHFLGISCFNAESSVKSAINLERVCEAGVSFSRRKVVQYPRTTSGALGQINVIPTGVISKDEIVNPDFRTLFATLNSNKLIADKVNANTGRYQYDFITLYQNNFDGAFSNFSDGNYDMKTSYEGSITVSRTYERQSKGYYMFRMGLKSGESNLNKYLLHSAITESGQLYHYLQFPMYENSFYFYFGLHDGATALDKFYEKFYGSCLDELESVDNKVFVFIDTQKPIPVADEGTVTVQFEGAFGEIKWEIYEEVGAASALKISGRTSESAISVNLPPGSYYIKIDDNKQYYFIVEDWTLEDIGIIVGATARTEDYVMEVSVPRYYANNFKIFRETYPYIERVLIKTADGAVVGQVDTRRNIITDLVPKTFTERFTVQQAGVYNFIVTIKDTSSTSKGYTRTYEITTT